jgi:hypothetical protein
MNHFSEHPYIDLTNLEDSPPAQQLFSKKSINMSSDIEGSSQVTIEADFRAMGPIKVVSTLVTFITCFPDT